MAFARSLYRQHAVGATRFIVKMTTTIQPMLALGDLVPVLPAIVAVVLR